MKKIFLKKLLSSTLKLWSYNALSILLLVCFLSCIRSSNEDLLNNYLLNNHSVILNDEIKAIIIISERGGCMNCNKSFSSFVANEIENPSILYIVCSTGIKIDISPYINKSNTLFDYNDKFGEMGLLKKSGVLFIEERKIDTIVEISVETFEYDIDFINTKLNQSH